MEFRNKESNIRKDLDYRSDIFHNLCRKNFPIFSNQVQFRRLLLLVGISFFSSSINIVFSSIIVNFFLPICFIMFCYHEYPRDYAGRHQWQSVNINHSKQKKINPISMTFGGCGAVGWLAIFVYGIITAIWGRASKFTQTHLRTSLTFR